MARLGIDYGTTNTVVVCHDRGRYPLVPHRVETSIGPVTRDLFPSLAVWDREKGHHLFGLEAERCLALPGAEERFCVIRSLKRLIRDYTDGVRVGFDMMEDGIDPETLLTSFASALKDSILDSGLFGKDEPLETVLTWPANANGAQRYLTRLCFKKAGFKVVDTLNEPTAAALEFADRVAAGNRTRSRRLSLSVAVFDLGGGTFDVSLVRIEGTDFHIIDSAGIERLGGDDLDDALAGLFLKKIGFAKEELKPYQRALLQLQARQQKENLSRGAQRSLTINPSEIGLEGEPRSIPAASFLKEADKILAPALDKLHALVTGPAARRAGLGPDNLDHIYLVGGSSKLPLVAKRVAERFPGVQLIQSDKPFTATAMGAAIHGREHVRLHEILSRTFGVYRLVDCGTRECFSPIFPAGTRLPRRGARPLSSSVEYAPQHNIGHLRYLECAAVSAEGRPAEGVREWSDALFPYDPTLAINASLDPEQIRTRLDLSGERILETYSCDSDGVITVKIRRSSDGRSKTYEIFKV